METRIIIYKKRKHSVFYDFDGKNIKVMVDGNEPEQIWRYDKDNVWFAPYKIGSYNTWVVIYNNKPYLVEGGESMTKADFVSNYIPKAYNSLAMVCFVFFLLMLPTLAFSVIHHIMHSEKNLVYIVLMTCGYVIFHVLNMMPIATYNKRRIWCLLSLSCHVLSFLFFIMQLM